MLIMTDLAEPTSEAGSQTLPGLFNQTAAEIAPTRTPYDKRWLGVALIVVLLSLWEASARCKWVTSDYWPPFSLVLRAALYGLGDKDMMSAFLSTISRSALGYAAGSGVGIILNITGSKPVGAIHAASNRRDRAANSGAGDRTAADPVPRRG
jgi:hypothetical protein